MGRVDVATFGRGKLNKGKQRWGDDEDSSWLKARRTGQIYSRVDQKSPIKVQEIQNIWCDWHIKQNRHSFSWHFIPWENKSLALKGPSTNKPIFFITKKKDIIIPK